MPRIARRPFSAILSAGLLLAAGLLLSACGLLGDDDDGNGNGGATPTATTSPVTVLQAVMSNEVSDERQATGIVGRVFPAGVDSIYAVLTLEDVEPGMEITGRWFQLSVPDAPPDGMEVSEAGLTLEEGQIEEGRTRVALNVTSNAGLPEGDWVARIYADGVFIRTMAFVITSQVSVAPGGGGQGPQGQTGSTGAPPPETIEVAQEYTVVEGDSYQSIAERFKGENESVEAFVTRLAQLNQLQPGQSLTVGQVLRIPVAQ